MGLWCKIEKNKQMTKTDLLARLAENIKRIRKDKKLTQFELAEKADLSEMTIKKIETARQWTSDGTLVQLANALEVDVSGFFVPVEGDFKVDEEIKKRVRCVLKEGFAHFVEDSFNQIADGLSP